MIACERHIVNYVEGPVIEAKITVSFGMERDVVGVTIRDVDQARTLLEAWSRYLLSEDPHEPRPKVLISASLELIKVDSR